VTRSRVLRCSWLIGLTLIAAGCGVTPPTASPPTAVEPAPTPTVAATAVESTAGLASPSSSGAPTPVVSASVSTGPGLVVDAGLLDVLPPAVGAVEMEGDPITAASLVSNPDLAASASAVAIARYVGPGDSSGDDLAVVSLVRLRPGVFSDGFFDRWRSDYDSSACEAAGGVTGTETVRTIGTSEVHVGSCAGGATTYHLHRDDDVLVSIIAVGSGRLGEGVVAGLRP
jgi:hypothetical protein